VSRICCSSSGGCASVSTHSLTHSSLRYVDQTDHFVGATYGKKVDNGGPPFVVSAASGVKSVLSLKKATLIAPHERSGPLYGK
jgi:hypothetical protein